MEINIVEKIITCTAREKKKRSQYVVIYYADKILIYQYTCRYVLIIALYISCDNKEIQYKQHQA